jgi:hypothetical protein
MAALIFAVIRVIARVYVGVNVRCFGFMVTVLFLGAPGAARAQKEDGNGR